MDLYPHPLCGHPKHFCGVDLYSHHPFCEVGEGGATPFVSLWWGEGNTLYRLSVGGGSRRWGGSLSLLLFLYFFFFGHKCLCRKFTYI
jgi:hypothetical protein